MIDLHPTLPIGIAYLELHPPEVVLFDFCEGGAIQAAISIPPRDVTDGECRGLFFLDHDSLSWRFGDSSLRDSTATPVLLAPPGRFAVAYFDTRIVVLSLGTPAAPIHLDLTPAALGCSNALITSIVPMIRCTPSFASCDTLAIGCSDGSVRLLSWIISTPTPIVKSFILFQGRSITALAVASFSSIIDGGVPARSLCIAGSDAGGMAAFYLTASVLADGSEKPDTKQIAAATVTWTAKALVDAAVSGIVYDNWSRRARSDDSVPPALVATANGSVVAIDILLGTVVASARLGLRGGRSLRTGHFGLLPPRTVVPWTAGESLIVGWKRGPIIEAMPSVAENELNSPMCAGIMDRLSQVCWCCAVCVVRDGWHDGDGA